VLLANFLYSWREGFVMVVADSWEQVMLNLEIKSKGKIKSKTRVLGEVH